VAVSVVRANGYQIDVVEIYGPNAEFLRGLDWINNVVNGSRYDVVFWWHGLEHIDRKDLPGTLSQLKDLSSRLVVLGCPWGYYEQGEVGGNQWERHLSHLDRDDFEDLGFRTSVVGIRNVRGSNLLASYEHS